MENKYYISKNKNSAIEVIEVSDEITKYAITHFTSMNYNNYLLVIPLKIEYANNNDFKEYIEDKYISCTKSDFEDLFNKITQIDTDLKELKKKYNLL